MPSNVLHRSVTVIALATSSCLSMAGGLPANAAEPILFKVGEAAPANTFLAIWMARDAGFYEAQGLKLEIVGMILNFCGVVRLPPGSNTVMTPVVAPATTVAVMFSLSTEMTFSKIDGTCFTPLSRVPVNHWSRA